jgi:hypothetical protein
VIEVSSGRYTHIGIGTIDKIGSYNGGEYHYGCWWYLNHTTYSGDAGSGSHQFPMCEGDVHNGSKIRYEDGYSPTANYGDWSYVRTTTGADTVAASVRTLGDSLAAWMYWSSPNRFNGVASLIPLEMWKRHVDGTYRMMGYMPDFRYINMKYLTAGQELTYGSETWKVFPVKQKGERIAGNTTPFSLWYGIAFKKIV